MIEMAAQPRSIRRKLLWFFLLLAVATAGLVAADWYTAFPADVEKSFVGGARCIECHQQQGHEWQDSHHDLAMDLANSDTVRGDFNDQTLTHHGITSRMFRDGDRYMVHTEGPDGEMTDFEVKYVFGYEPLQQYMVELDPPAIPDGKAIGRVQVLRLSWDTEQGRWFYLNPPDVNEKLAPNDPLHWTGAAQNWNHMCAVCHSTNLVKGFDVAQHKYQTTFQDIDVSCEACHGPGSLHSDIAESKWLLWDRRHGYGLVRMKQAAAKVQVETCAPCHSRRSPVCTGFACGEDYLDHYANGLLTPSTYYPDGQILDEVYVYGSFIQSRMYHNDIRCTDCHHPHSNRLKFDDNRLCTSCHQHDVAKYDTPAHHHHPAGSTGSLCIECHMPATPYMEVDLRRDHSFKVPRPDLSLELSTPNACTGCHLEPENIDPAKLAELKYYADWLQAARDGDTEVEAELARVNRWAADLCQSWYPSKPQDQPVEYAAVLQRAWQMDPEAVPELVALAQNKKVAGIVRASAVMWLRQYPSEQGILAARQALRDPDPQVRAAAVPFFEAVTPAERIPDISPLLDDPSRNVRIQAALVLADCSKVTLSQQQLNWMKTSLLEYRNNLNVNSDLAASHMGIAILADRLGDKQAAVDSYRRAIRVQPGVTGPRSNLAALLESVNRPEEAQSLRKQELELMARDAALAADNGLIQYRLGLAFYLDNQIDRAEEALRRSVELEPQVADYAMALALLYRKQQRFDESLVLVAKMIELQPKNLMFRQLQREIRAEQAGLRPAAPTGAAP